MLNLENTRRIAKGDKPIDKLDALETEFNKELEENTTPKPEKDGYLVETAHVLLDYITYNEQTK